ncbi:unnamed protein product [Microthlaspi erraticum]|uniref:Protein kinase domain-containing protein n=1 Tax=Microthlaspi erraticum TaxID=1685480 RepID=A0A6D2LCL6_9BRAS|nr:unnamed protein product [Microthlaspi erraticum]
MTQKLIQLLVASLPIILTLVQAKTDNQEVSALNVMFTSLNSPSKLKGWKSSGGDPCDGSWEGVKCKGSSVTELQLSGYELSGTLGYLLTNLKSLTTLNVEDNQFEGWIPNELKEIDSLLTGGNDWSTETAPPPPPGVKYGRKSGSNGGGGMTSVNGVMIAVASVGVLLLIAVLIGLVSKKKSSLNPHFIDEDYSQHTPKLKSLASHGSAQELRIDFGNDYKGDSDDDHTHGIGAKGLKHSVSSRVMSFNDTEFANRLNAKRSNSTRSAVEFELSDLQNATANFAPGNLLGEGSIGRVYRAKYPDGRTLAVKKIDSTLFDSGKSEGITPIVMSVSKIRHQNIAELVGYCSELGHNMLIYDYFRNGSLHEFLHLSDCFSKPLTWNTRVRIALGSARAIEYLHEACSPPLMHKNIKSSNILLDADLNPRLSDYGLSKFYLRTSQNLGEGYNAPEANNPDAYTSKSDVYSFGVVMLELLTGRVPFDGEKPRPERSLVRWATPQLHDIEALSNIADPALHGLYEPKSLSRFADIIASCVQVEPEFRPPMSEVVEGLNPEAISFHLTKNLIDLDEVRLLALTPNNRRVADHIRTKAMAFHLLDRPKSFLDSISLTPTVNEHVKRVSIRSTLSKVPLLHLHCREMVLPNIAKFLHVLNKQETDPLHPGIISKPDPLRFVASMPSHMKISWNIMSSYLV